MKEKITPQNIRQLQEEGRKSREVLYDLLPPEQFANDEEKFRGIEKFLKENFNIEIEILGYCFEKESKMLKDEKRVDKEIDDLEKIFGKSVSVLTTGHSI